jgi:hypothetical protein
MISSDLLSILQKISPTDHRALRKFIASPFANLRADVSQLYDFIEKHRELSPASLTREAAHEAVYPGQPFDDKQLRRLMSYLLKVVENYLTQTERMADGRQNDIALAAAYRKLGLEKHARQALEAAAAAKKNEQGRDFQHYETQYLLEAESLAFSESARRTAPRNLQAVNHSLDLAYLAKKLRQSCVALSHQAVANVEYDLGLLGLVLGYLDANDLPEQHPAIGLYFYFYQAATTGVETYFEKLKAGILRHGSTLTTSELRLIYLLAINYCIRRINEGAVRFNQDLFELYSAALQSDVLLEKWAVEPFCVQKHCGIGTAARRIRLDRGFHREIQPRRGRPTPSQLHRLQPRQAAPCPPRPHQGHAPAPKSGVRRRVPELRCQGFAAENLL